MEADLSTQVRCVCFQQQTLPWTSALRQFCRFSPRAFLKAFVFEAIVYFLGCCLGIGPGITASSTYWRASRLSSSPRAAAGYGAGGRRTP